MCYNDNMKKTVAFFGHRLLWGREIRERVKKEIESNLNEDVCCLVGTHGEFDSLVLSVCREIKKDFPYLKITVVFTSLNVLQKRKGEIYSDADMYKDVDTVIYDIEEEYYKKQIEISNRKMVDESDLIICYIDKERRNSGAKKAVAYAIKQGKRVINLFQEQDRPFYGMTSEEKEKKWKEFISNDIKQ